MNHASSAPLWVPTTTRTCPDCGGSGIETETLTDRDGHPYPSPLCDCERCKGDGYILVEL